MNQIDYKKQYKLDNIFNICIISLAFIAQDYKVGVFAILLAGFMVNVSSARFFYDKKYSDDTDKENKENKPAITSVWKVYYDWEPGEVQFKVNAVTKK